MVLTKHGRGGERKEGNAGAIRERLMADPPLAHYTFGARRVEGKGRGGRIARGARDKGKGGGERGEAC